MRNLRLATVAVGALAATAAGLTSASAADLAARPVYKAPIVAPIPTWQGFYIGVNAGGAIASNDTTSNGVLRGGAPGLPAGLQAVLGLPLTAGLFNDSFRHSPAGAVLGGQIGYNFQWAPNFVVGLEADWQWTSQKDTATVGGCAAAPATIAGVIAVIVAGAPLTANCLSEEQKLTNFGTARARAGVVVNDSLWYVTGGGAWGTVKDSYAYTSTSNIATIPGVIPAFPAGAGNFSHNKAGWTIGGGVETRLGYNWSLKLEYLYVDLGSYTDTFGVAPSPALAAILALPGAVAVGAFANTTVTSSSHFRDNVVRVGLNYKIF
jgi:outer membrane immunogenic protein